MAYLCFGLLRVGTRSFLPQVLCMAAFCVARSKPQGLTSPNYSLPKVCTRTVKYHPPMLTLNKQSLPSCHRLYVPQTHVLRQAHLNQIDFRPITRQMEVLYARKHVC